jgi:heme-degrading monooxygenase HmoA
MITKIAMIEVKPGMEQEFIAGVEKATPLFLCSQGCRGLTLERNLEMPEQFVLRVCWDNVSDNVDLFVNSDNFRAWRALVGHCFARKPHVYYTETLLARGEQTGNMALRVAI